MIRFLQANLDRARVVQALIMQTMHETKADIAITSEQNRIPDNDGWYCSSDSTCCLYLAPEIEVTRSAQGHGYVSVDTLGIRVYSCYYLPNKRYTVENYKTYLSHIEDSVRQGPINVIVDGDFNAHSPSWGSPNTCVKSEALLDIASSLGLIARNQGDNPTYERGGHASHIDVTFTSPSVIRRINEWQVL